MFDVLPGFRDFYPEDLRKRNFIFERWKAWATRFDFQQYDIPTLEPLELFTQKAGEEIVSQLFHFVDQGGRAVALRPELTSSLARMVGAKINSLKRPVKWFNIAENFRYERQQKGRLRSHYQLNADIFGEPGAGADAEVIGLALALLQDFGLSSAHLQCRLSDRELWSLFLESLGYTGEKALSILGVIDKMERMEPADVQKKLQPWFHDATDDFLASVEYLRAQRDLDGVRTAILRLLPTGDLRERAETRIAVWEELLTTLESMGLGAYLRIDLGIVRGLAYYTGFVFEIFQLDTAGATTGRALAGGGRFDHLIGLLGYPDTPAVGFGMGDVVLGDALEELKLLPPLIDAPDFMMVIGGAEERLSALADAAVLRHQGYRVSYPLKLNSFNKQFRAVGQSGAAFALIYGSEELAGGQVRLRDLRSGEERLLARPEFLRLAGHIWAAGLSELPS